VYLPVLLRRDDGVAHANDWAHGFMRGVKMRRVSWSELLNDEDHSGPMVAILMWPHEHDPDPQMRPAPIAPEMRAGALQTMIAGLTHIFRYFEPDRRALKGIPPRTPARRRHESKAGHNEPCPCGSALKSRHCCLIGTPALH
jgi:uncharacterized protein